jgi:ComF family protein
LAEQAVAASEVERDRKRVTDVVQAVGEPLRNLTVQKIVVARRRGRAIPADAEETAIENPGGGVHWRQYGLGRRGAQWAALAGRRLGSYSRTGGNREGFDAMNAVTALPTRLMRAVVDGLLPPCCLGCGAGVERQGTLCAECWTSLTLLGPPCCACCGHPFPYAADDVALCAACSARPPVFDSARAVFRYDDASRTLVLRFKHADETHGAAFFGHWLARAGMPLCGRADLIAPVPLHRWRLLARRYNQAALLAGALARAADKPLAVDLLQRRRHTPSQARLSPVARRRNVRAAFALRRQWTERVRDRRVLLVDDVFTTGATVEECARVLRRAGASGVDVVTLARVVRPR